MPRGRHARPPQTPKNLKRCAVGGLAAATPLLSYTPAQAVPEPLEAPIMKHFRAPIPAVVPPLATPAPATAVVVVPGDTLSEIAIQDLGLPSWQPLYEENRDVIGANPDLILPGQSLHYAGGLLMPREPVPVEVPAPPVEVPQVDVEVPEAAGEVAPPAALAEAIINNSAGPVSVRAQAAANAVFTYVRGASLISIGGTRSSARDMNGHPSGNALDYMVGGDSALGDAIVSYHVAHWDELGVDYIIWQQRIRYSAGGGWEAMADRGSPTQNHMDHPHVNYR